MRVAPGTRDTWNLHRLAFITAAAAEPFLCDRACGLSASLVGSHVTCTQMKVSLLLRGSVWPHLTPPSVALRC